MKDQKQDLMKLKMENDKVFFCPGDLVTLKQDLPNKPVMLVIKKETSMFKNQMNKDNILKGIRCRWFTESGEIQEAIFNTKDLQLI